MEKPHLQPGIRPGGTPPLHEFGADPFERLCRDVLNEEREIAACGIYGKRGQRQRGIDLIANRQAGDGIEVGQCKCYKEFTEKDLVVASDEFLAHQAYWQNRDVRRFILFIGCDLVRTQCHEEIIVQKNRFAACRVLYEVWDASQIVNKLRPHPSIIGQHFGSPEYWTRVICGPPTEGGVYLQGTSPNVSAASSVSPPPGQPDAKVALTDSIERELGHHRELLRSGRSTEAREWVATLRENTSRWDVLPEPLKAKIIRFEAAIAIDAVRDIPRAKQLLAEAKSHDASPDDGRIETMIVYHECGAEEALRTIEKHTGEEMRDLRAALLLEIGRTDEMFELLDNVDGETGNT